MSDNVDKSWVAGFVKAANDAGITDPTDVDALLLLAKRAELALANPTAYEQGVIKAAEEAGLDKEAILGMLAAGAGLATAGAGLFNRWRNRNQGWNEVSKSDAAGAHKAYGNKGILGKGWANLTNPAMMNAVKTHKGNMQASYAREQDPTARRAYGQEQRKKFQDKANAWGGGRGGRGGGRGRGSYYANYYRRPRY